MKNIEDVLAKASRGLEAVPDGWVPATGLRPLLKSDPGLLWLTEHGHDIDEVESDSPKFAFQPFINKIACSFEHKWMKELAPNAVRAIERDWDVRKVASLKRTLELMAQRTPVITKAALWWGDEKIYGCADSVWLTSELYRVFPHLKPADWKASEDGYEIVDAKFTSRLHTPQKREDLEQYACQMRIYSYALAHMQSKPVKNAWLATRDRVFDPIQIEINQAVGQPLDKDLRKHRDTYLKIKRGNNLRPWKDKEVEPNYTSKENYPWASAVTKIQTELVKGQSLTMLPGIGNKLADALEEKGFTSLADMLAKRPEDLPLEEVEGIGKTTAARIRAVLKANKTKKATPIPAEIVPEEADIELMVDYEFLSNVNVDMEKQWPILLGCEMVAVCGVWHRERGKWHYRYFVAEEESHRAERKMFKEFLAFLDEKGVFNPTKTAVLYSWGDAERAQTRKAIERHGGALKRLEGLVWCDLLSEVFHAVPLAIPGQWNFGLKEVVTALGAFSPRHKVEWKPGLSNGANAQIALWEAYAQKHPLASKQMDMVISYLESDVKSLLAILNFLRENAVETTPRSAQADVGWYRAVVGYRDGQTLPIASLSTAGWYTKSDDSPDAR